MESELLFSPGFNTGIENLFSNVPVTVIIEILPYFLEAVAEPGAEVRAENKKGPAPATLRADANRYQVGPGTNPIQLPSDVEHVGVHPSLHSLIVGNEGDVEREWLHQHLVREPDFALQVPALNKTVH